MNRFFMYVDPTEYEMTQEGLMKACLAEVIAEAEDTGDYPMYRPEDLIQSFLGLTSQKFQTAKANFQLKRRSKTTKEK